MANRRMAVATLALFMVQSLGLTAGVVRTSPMSTTTKSVVLTSTLSMTAKGKTTQAQVVESIHGQAMSVQVIRPGDPGRVYVYDVAGNRVVILHRDKQEAEIYDAATAAAEVEKRLPSDRIIGEVTPTGRTKDLLGVRCEEYSFALKGPLTDTVLLVRSGTAWLAKQGPGVEEYLSFYRAAGTVLAAGSIKAPKEMVALSRTDTEFYRRIAALGGMPYAIDTKISVEGTGLVARMLGDILNLSESTTTTAVDTTPLQEQMFAVPTGWKTKFIGYAKDKRH